MCKGDNCPIKDQCYRYRAVPAKHWQTYFIEPPMKEGKCEQFWKIDYRDRLQEKKE